MPSQLSLGRDDSRQFGEDLSPKPFGSGCEATALVVVEPQAPAGQQFANGQNVGQ